MAQRYLNGVLEDVPAGESIPLTVAPISPVTARQFRLALIQLGLFASVDAAVQASDEATKVSFEYSTMFYRDNPLVLNVATALGKTSQEVDDLFLLAATL